MRRVKQGTTWHPANDNLAGTYAFGTFPLDFSVDTFSIPFSTLVNQNTQMLFRSGTPQALTCDIHHTVVSLLILGDESRFLITTYGATNNNGIAFTSTARSVVKSSTNPSARTYMDACVLR